MILIGLGANLPSDAGAPADTLRRAVDELERRDVKILRLSGFYETQAWPDHTHPAFINAVARVQTPYQPVELLTVLHAVETALGRLRSAPNAPRTLDLDLLDFNGQLMSTRQLTLPHPRLAARNFVLVPLRDVAPAWRHPVTGISLSELLAALPDGATPKKLP